MSDTPFRIMLVEDNDADVYLFRKALENAGLNFELIVIGDGAEALAFVRRQGAFAGRPVPDLAVFDLNMPKYSGIEVLKAIRQSQDLPQVPVVITTALASPREREVVDHLGVERHISKPADLEGFLQIGAVFKEVLLEARRRHPIT